MREQSRIEAGDGGFQIVVNGNTDLKGAAITSSQQAVDEGLNRLTTGTLITSDIENHANYKGSSVSLGGGYSSNGDDNFSATPPIAIAAKGNSSSTTHSGISGAQITITDEAKQQLLTGETVEERLASLHTDVLTGQDGSNALTPIFNEQEIKAGFEIVGALQRETGTFLNNRAKEATAAKEALDKELAKPESERDPARLAALQQQVNDSATWAPGGTGRQVLTALAAAAGGNVTGASSQFAQDLVVNYLQQQGAGYIGQLVKDGTLTEGSPLHAALHGVVACAGAAASDQSCGSGALGAATSSLLTNLFVDAPDETAEAKEAKRNLLATLVTGIAVAGGADVATSTNSAIAAVENNYLSQAQKIQKEMELLECESGLCEFGLQMKWAAIDIGQSSSYAAGMLAGVPAGLADTVESLVKMVGSPLETYSALESLLKSDDVFGEISDAVKQSYIDRINKLESEYQRAGASGSFNAGLEAGKLFTDLAGLLAGGVGVAKSGALLVEKVTVKVASKAAPTAGGIGHKASDASNIALYPKLKDDLMRQNLDHIAKQDPRLAIAVQGDGSGRLNFGMGTGTSSEAERLGMIWVGDGAKLTTNQRDCPGCWVSADGTRGYRPSSNKNSPFAHTGKQANFELYEMNDFGIPIKVGNGHLNIVE